MALRSPEQQEHSHVVLLLVWVVFKTTSHVYVNMVIYILPYILKHIIMLITSKQFNEGRNPFLQKRKLRLRNVT